MQAWTASAYGCLPSSASVYAGTFGMFGPKSPLRRLDGLHWMLASGLALVSAALGVYIMKGQHLKKQVNNSNTELSRLLLKVSTHTSAQSTSVQSELSYPNFVVYAKASNAARSSWADLFMQGRL